MIAVRVTDELPLVVAGSPAYFAQRGKPKTPDDLVAHDCIRIRFSSGTYVPWRFRVKRRDLEVHVEGRLVMGIRQSWLRAAGAHRFKLPENDNRVTVLLTACPARLWLECLAVWGAPVSPPSPSCAGASPGNSPRCTDPAAMRRSPRDRRCKVRRHARSGRYTPQRDARARRRSNFQRISQPVTSVRSTNND